MVRMCAYNKHKIYESKECLSVKRIICILQFLKCIQKSIIASLRILLYPVIPQWISTNIIPKVFPELKRTRKVRRLVLGLKFMRES